MTTRVFLTEVKFNHVAMHVLRFFFSLHANQKSERTDWPDGQLGACNPNLQVAILDILRIYDHRRT